MAKKLKQGDICKILEAFDDEIDLAEIPSDTDSIVDEVEVFDEENLQELFDAIVEDDNEDVGIVEREELGFSRAHNSREVYDSDDEVPLADLRRNRNVKEIEKPEIIHDYNMHMNNVDKLDQLKKYYELNRKSRKWWHRIFFHFLDIAVVNSFIISKSIGYHLPLKDFKLDLISILCSSASPPTLGTKNKKQARVRIKKNKPYVDPSLRSSSSYQPVRTTLRRCAYCSTTSHQRRTQWMCSSCNVPLCLSKTKTCFNEFHK